MMMNKDKKMQEAIDVAWENPDGAELRAQLFPEGKPTPEIFVERLAAYARRTFRTEDPKAPKIF